MWCVYHARAPTTDPGVDEPPAQRRRVEVPDKRRPLWTSDELLALFYLRSTVLSGVDGTSGHLRNTVLVPTNYQCVAWKVLAFLRQEL